MKYVFLPIICLFISCATKVEGLKSEDIIEKSIQKHDPKKKWNTVALSIHIQEPRIQNPSRYSILNLDNKTGSFELTRNRERSTSLHSIDKEGNSITLLDNKIISDTLLIKKYRLDPKRNFGYKRFYQLLLGLPMSLKNEKISIEEEIENTNFNQQNAYQVKIELDKVMFSKHWNLFFSQNDFTLLGVEMIFPDDAKKGERLIFSGSIHVDDILFPRIRHWYELDGTYSGSDIIIKEIK